MCSTTVLYITDEMHSYCALQDHFLKDDIKVNLLQQQSQLLPELEEKQPSLILLDCPEQGIRDLTLCQEIRKLYAGPLALLVNQSNVQFSILALDLGADVSLSLPDGIPLLAANIKALLRRFSHFTSSLFLTFGNLLIDARKRDAFLSGRQVNLSTIEFQLLWFLTQKSGTVVSRKEIHHELYDSNYNGYDRNIDLYISRIRQKIGDDSATPQYVKTVRGIGYQLVSTKDPVSIVTS